MFGKKNDKSTNSPLFQIDGGGYQEDFRLNVEVADYATPYLDISGWAYVKGTRLIEVDVQLRKLDGSPIQHILVSGIERADVWAASGQLAEAMRSGFRGRIPLSVLDDNVSFHLEFTTLEGKQFGATLLPRHIEVPNGLRLKNIINAASKKRVARGIECILRGKWRYLWHQISRLSELEEVLQSESYALDRVLSCYAHPNNARHELESAVDIIIPVYNGFDYLAPLFSSLKRNTDSKQRIIIIDDCSPDKRVWPALQQMCGDGSNIVLLQNQQNLGFVRTVNKGASFAKGDFVILNTDIEVPQGWLERLMKPMLLDRTVATTTPFSNAATICSFPLMNEDNPLPNGIDFNDIDGCFNQLNSDMDEVVAPSGVGFCMAINGDAWRTLGGFDEKTFLKGYGEENDWCQRANSKGYRNVIVQNLFVYHKHGGSFESLDRQKLRQDNYTKLVQRWPNYPKSVDKFIRSDPLAHPRLMAILLTFCNLGDTKPLLIIDHDIGGGANTYRKKIVAERVAQGQSVFVLTQAQNFTLGQPGFHLDFYFQSERIRFDFEKISSLERLFSLISLGEVFYNNLVSYSDPLRIVDFLCELIENKSAYFSFALHDFYALSPSYTLLDSKGTYPGIECIEDSWKDIENNAFAANPKGSSIDEWHQGWRKLLLKADKILCFSNDSQRHLQKVYPEASKNSVVCPHSLNTVFKYSPLIENYTAMNIAVVGAIGQQKGARVVEELAELLEKQDPGAKISVIGTLNSAKSFDNLSVHGPYIPEELPVLLEKYRINVAIFPSIWPETFSYVAEELMVLGVPLVCFDLGAPAERVSKYERGLVASERTAMGLLNAMKALHDKMLHNSQ